MRFGVCVCVCWCVCVFCKYTRGLVHIDGAVLVVLEDEDEQALWV